MGAHLKACRPLVLSDSVPKGMGMRFRSLRRSAVIPLAKPSGNAAQVWAKSRIPSIWPGWARDRGLAIRVPTATVPGRQPNWGVHGKKNYSQLTLCTGNSALEVESWKLCRRTMPFLCLFCLFMRATSVKHYKPKSWARLHFSTLFALRTGCCRTRPIYL